MRCIYAFFFVCLVASFVFVSSEVWGVPDGHLADEHKTNAVFVIHEDEYDASKTLPAFAKEALEEKLGWKCTYVQGKEIHNLPGLEVLESADVMIVYVRRQVLPESQLKYIRAHCEAGKPVVGIRTASHAFAGREGRRNPAGVEWPEFDQDVLGGNYTGHHGNKGDIPTVIWGAEGAKEHPVLGGVTRSKHTTTSWLYQVLPLSKKAVPLMMGQVADRVPVEPVAWTNESTYGGRVFYTSLGHPDDFAVESFRNLLRNGIIWTTLGGEGAGSGTKK